VQKLQNGLVSGGNMLRYQFQLQVKLKDRLAQLARAHRRHDAESENPSLRNHHLSGMASLAFFDQLFPFGKITRPADAG
jgi:hypothetical protein